jgi:uncharacterized GH25 family protein
MYRMLGAIAMGLLATTLAQAHFPFIVLGDKGDSAKVVFSDSLEPDTNVNIEKLANTKLTLRDSAGKDSALEWKKGEGFYAVNVPGTGDRVVFGTTDYGVLQKGDAKPFKLMYYPKAVVGTATAKAIGEKQPLEIVAEGKSAALRFQVLLAGKPLENAEVTVMLPAGNKKALTTDKNGFTTPIDGAGRYGVYAKHIEAKAGEHAGKKYDEIRHYATLVCDVK